MAPEHRFRIRQALSRKWRVLSTSPPFQGQITGRLFLGARKVGRFRNFYRDAGKVEAGEIPDPSWIECFHGK